jgi:adenosylcobinamide kinase / adenosylcobinamide-phosphate guanylyltransferase
VKSTRHLVLGAARSGKTRLALNLASELARVREGKVIYVATAEAHDAEMRERIARHRAERPKNWHTLEAPRELGSALGAIAPPTATAIATSAVIVIDCLTLWLSNAVLADFDEESPTSSLPTWVREREAFMSWLAECEHALVVVSNEVGGGIVPASALARRFQSEQGWLNQDVARVCEEVTLVVAGLPLSIKSAARSGAG